MRKIFIALAPIAAAVSAPAMAQDPAESVTITIQTNDLDLTDAADQARLDSRVDRAISRACRVGGRDADARRAEAACRADLADTIAPQIEVAILDANATRFASLDLNPGA